MRPAAADAGRSLGSCTRAPSRRRSPPSVTTRSPASRPLVTAMTSLVATPRSTGRIVTVRSSLMT
jgi:hypothetical protein